MNIFRSKHAGAESQRRLLVCRIVSADGLPMIKKSLPQVRVKGSVTQCDGAPADQREVCQTASADKSQNPQYDDVWEFGTYYLLKYIIQGEKKIINK
jgi:hypothetical protein